MALAEKIGLEILKDQKGPITQMEETIFNQLRNVYKLEPKQIVILRGYGDQKLFEVLEIEDDINDPNAGKSNFANAISTYDPNTTETKSKPAGEQNKNKVEIPAVEGKYTLDEERKVSSLKNGYISTYFIPYNMKVSSENAIEMKRY